MSTGYATYIPSQNAALSLWIANFAATAAAAPSIYGFTSSNIATINAANGSLQAAYTPLTSHDTKTTAAVAAFNAARQAALNQIRPLAIQVAASQAIGPDDKRALGVTVPKTTRSPIPTPTTFPLLSIKALVPGTIQFQSQDSALPSSKAKPFGVTGLQLYSDYGTVYATTPGQCQLNQIITKSPFTINYDGTLSGSKATFFARWFTKGTLTSGGQAVPGPWNVATQFVLP